MFCLFEVPVLSSQESGAASWGRLCTPLGIETAGIYFTQVCGLSAVVSFGGADMELFTFPRPKLDELSSGSDTNFFRYLPRNPWVTAVPRLF
jgi:hypothetical protein